MPSTDLIVLRHDLLPAAIGFILMGLGVAAGAVAFARRRQGDPTLAYFSILTFVYGLRLLMDLDAAEVLYPLAKTPGWDKAIYILSYLVPIPAGLLFESLAGRGWKGSLRWFWQAFVALAVVAVPAEIMARQPGALMTPYRFLVLTGALLVIANVFLPGQGRTGDLHILRGSFLVLLAFAIYENVRAMEPIPRTTNVEPVGFLLFVCGLGTVAARRVFGDQERLAAIRQELATARAIQESILPGAPPRIDGLDLASRYVPASEVAGDFYEFLPGEGRRLGILVADVSGHGVPAALVATMLKVAVAAQGTHAASPGRVLSEVNAIFHGKLKNQFITALYVYLDLEAGEMTAASAGHPPPLVWRHDSGQVEELPPGGLVIGRLRRAAYPQVTVPLAAGDRVLLFTDGIPEALSPGGEMFGEERLRQVLVSHASQPAEATAGALLAQVAAWTGRTAAFDDDLTLVVAGIG
ncbi:MAG TPA: PP2C family protein-serine/threonine phosphatase [Thermoanaerobaculia bacterium]|nr:PP2C family protein-serine/threonine phosphatase [Thermoanaerobaculia bacterium]